MRLVLTLCECVFVIAVEPTDCAQVVSPSRARRPLPVLVSPSRDRTSPRGEYNTWCQKWDLTDTWVRSPGQCAKPTHHSRARATVIPSLRLRDRGSLRVQKNAPTHGKHDNCTSVERYSRGARRHPDRARNSANRRYGEG